MPRYGPGRIGTWDGADVNIKCGVMMSTEEDHFVNLVLCTHTPDMIRLREIVTITCVSLTESLGQRRTLDDDPGDSLVSVAVELGRPSASPPPAQVLPQLLQRVDLYRR